MEVEVIRSNVPSTDNVVGGLVIMKGRHGMILC